MAQASQALPSWLTLSSTVITDATGGLITSFATLTLPLTYYGPPIPLGTDGTWVYGGLSSPAPTTAESTTAPTSTPSPSPSPSATPSSTLSSTSSLPSTSSDLTSTSAEPSLTPTSTTSLSESPPPTLTPVGTSHGLSKAAIGGLIGGIVGALLLLVLILTLCVLRRNRRRTSSHTSSSFWNRQTTLFTAGDPITTPIWTGWDLVSPTEAEEGIMTPGEGSPRHSGEEADPFLTRRASGTPADEMAQTKTGTDTLVSLPAAAIVGTAPLRSSPPRTGNIIPRDVINRMMDEGYDDPPANIRIVEPSPPSDHSPLLPPPLINTEGMGGLGLRHSRNDSRPSFTSQARSLGSQKSMGSLEDAELHVARRVRVGELHPEPGPSRTNNLGLQNISGRLGRFTWLRRMSLTAAGRATQASTMEGAAPDAYTRSPTRSSHRSRPSSYVRFQEDALTPRTPRVESGLGYNSASSRPISTVSGKSTSAASGNTIYHDAVSTPVSEVPDVPEIPERFQTRGGGGSSSNGGNGDSNNGYGSSGDNGNTFGHGSQQSLAQAPGDPTRFTAHGIYASIPNEPPPMYDDNSLPRHRSQTRLPSDIDVLDLPAPRSTNPFTSRVASVSASSFPPPGLVPIPSTWRESYPGNQSSPGGSADISIDIEDEPPTADAGWRTLAGGIPGPAQGRRTTFGAVGTPLVVNAPISPASEQGSLHSMRSHLSPYASRSPAGSAPASSNHTQSGSGSSRPSAHSHALTASSSVSDFDNRIGARRAGAVASVQPSEPPLRSPPLSAVFGGRTGARSPTPISDIRAASPPLVSPRSPRSFFPSHLSQEISPSSSRTPLLSGGDGTRDARWNGDAPSDEEW
ncbi:hypothetical protein BXZ70DRAFT_364637 [Cristinia sonorae]|uniref:Uncharacterized protein n=1 Tax=Cristinia sonorae TaxID=1940300 RepID=A0A8K0UJD5_9AGAR|nr:hypothetical protein BXZ70DRAFT_364637 [Cristinia sonorae]